MAIATAFNNKDSGQPVLSELIARGWSWKIFGAIFGLGGGILAPMIGSVFTAVSWLTGPTWHEIAVQRIGTIFLFMTIPLLLFGAHCLDLAERNKRQKNISRGGNNEEGCSK